MRQRRVSIPFIAGQWSLQADKAPPRVDALRFNPLHCGAVVASPGFPRTRTSPRRSFNPLHCGAVVAS